MDKNTDCAEYIRTAIWLFFGLDIGNSSESQYKNPNGVMVTADWNHLPKCEPLTIAYYHTNRFQENRSCGGSVRQYAFDTERRKRCPGQG